MNNKELYKGIHYHCDKSDHLKQELVRFRRFKKNGKHKYTLQVGTHTRIFEEDEFCFLELEEKGYDVVVQERKSPFIFLRQHKTKPEEAYQNFLCLTVVFYIVGDDTEGKMCTGSNRIKLFDKIEKTKPCRLRKFQNQLQKCFGDIKNQWFMYNIEDNNNERPVRVVLRKLNFSVLDNKLNVLHFHRLHNLEIKECYVNPHQRLLQMKIVENSSCQTYQDEHKIRLRSSVTSGDAGYSFRTDLCSQLHEIHQKYQNNVQMTPDADNRVLNWVANLQSASKNSYLPLFDIKPSSFSEVLVSENTFSILPEPCAFHFRDRAACEADWNENCKLVDQQESSLLENPSCCNLRQASEDLIRTGSEGYVNNSLCNIDDNQRESSLLQNPPCCVLRPPSGHMIRAESVNDLCLRQNVENNVCNTNEKRESGTSYDDSVYQKVYYKNTGWIKCSRNKVFMSHRIRRQKYIGTNMKGVDFNIVNKHEQWWDVGFKMRRDDEMFMKIRPEWKSVTRGYPTLENEDLYWNSDLCLTVQLMMERECPKLLCDLDLTWSQLCAVVIYLSLDSKPTCLRKDWRDFAELLGLKFRDIEIIQHFCYAQREWPARVVLCHWKLLTSRQRNVLPFSLDNFRFLLSQIGRFDILKITDYSDTNCLEDTDEVFCTTLF